MKIKQFYLIMMILGTVIPWLFFIDFFIIHGLDLPAFFYKLFSNGAAGGFSADLIISSLVFWVWSYVDAKENQIKHWWLVLPANFLVGLSLALPLYLYMRAGENNTKKT